MKTKMPSFDTLGEGLDAGSPSKSWNGPQTVRGIGGSIPIICGEVFVGGTIINEYITTDGDKSYLNSLVAIAEGELESVTLVRINRNLAANFSGYTIETKLGTNDQAAIAHFEDLHDIYTFGLTSPLTKNNPYTYTTQGSDVEAFEIRFNMPNGLWQQDSGGSILSNSIIYKIEYKLHSSGTWIDLGNTTISEKSRTELKRIFRKEGLTAGQYDIRITKLSDDSDFTHTTDFYLDFIDEINTDDLIYPNTGVTGIRALAIDQLSGDRPQYEFATKGVKMTVPKIMNGAVEVAWDDYYWDPDEECYRLISDDTELTWDGVTYVTRYSANAIWFMYYLMTNKRTAIGNFIETTDNDLDFLVEASQYCDELVPDGEGGWEKRFRIDICIDSPQKALDLFMQLCTIFRGLPYYSDQGKIKIAIDKPDTPVQLFGMGNIKSGSFAQTWNSKRNVPNILNVQFDNEDAYGAQDVVPVVDQASLIAGDPKNIQNVRYYGKKLSYAIRHGRNIIKTAKYINKIYNFKTGIGGFIRQCGEVIDIAHDVPQFGLASGRVKTGRKWRDVYDAEETYAINDAVSYSGEHYVCIKESTGNLPTDAEFWTIISHVKVKLDQAVTIEAAKSYAIRVDFADNNYEEGVVIDAPGTYTEITVSEAFTTAPEEWDSYSFGEVNKVVTPARIGHLKRMRNGEVEIEAEGYREDAYDDSAITLPEIYSSSLSLEIPDVTNLVLTEGLIKLLDGTIEDVIDVWFKRPDVTGHTVKRLSRVRVYLSDNAGASWTPKGETYGNHLHIQGGLTDLITYRIAVVSISDSGEEKFIDDSPYADITLVGKSAKPNNVTGFDVYQEGNFLKFSWDPVPDLDLSRYIIKKGSEWNTGVFVGEKVDVTEFMDPVSEIGILNFMIKAIDRSGNESEAPTIDTITVIKPPNMNFINTEDIWCRNLEYILNNVSIVKTNYYDSGYVRKAIALTTADTWEDREAESQTWEYQEANAGLELDSTCQTSGYIQPNEVIDLGELYEFKLVVDASYKNSAGGTLTVYISYSEDGITYSAFIEVTADTLCLARYIKFKFVLETSDDSSNVYFYGCIIYINAPTLKKAWGKDVAIPIGGKVLIFDAGFTIPPRVKPSIVNGTVGVVIIDNKTKDQCEANVYNLAGAAIDTAEIDWEAEGY
ncbi:MAG: hypothetical protein WC569_02255 [Candidatus Omnitrophota bacterium]